jgi:hypothetical protein
MIDPNTDTYATCSATFPGVTAGTTQLFISSVLGSDGYIYSIYNTSNVTNRVVRFNPLTLSPTSPNIIEYTAPLNSGIIYNQQAWASFSSGSYVYFMPRAIASGSTSAPTAMLRLNVTQFSNNNLNGLYLVQFPEPYGNLASASAWGNNITFGGTITLSSSLVVFTPRYTSTPTYVTTHSLSYNPQNNAFLILTHSAVTSNIYYGTGRNINGNGYIIPTDKISPMYNIIESGSGYSASIDLNFPLKNINKYISTSFGTNNSPSPSPSYKHIINQTTSTDQNTKYTASVAEFISVKGYYDGVTGFSPKDNEYIIPENISSLTSSLYNFYYNHF